MARIDRYMFRQLVAVFGFFGLVLVLVYWINRAVSLFDQLIADGQSAFVFLEFTALSLPGIISIILPIAAFAAAVYVTNRLSSDSELAIMQSGGISAQRMLRPYLYFAAVTVILQFALQHLLVPEARSTLQERRAEIAENATARLLVEGEFLSPGSGSTFYIKRITEEGELLSVVLSDKSDPAVDVTYSAARAFLVRSDDGPILVLIDGTIQRLTAATRALSVTRFNDFVVQIGDFLEVVPQREKFLSEMPTGQLLGLMQNAKDTDPARQRAIFGEIAERFVTSALPLVVIVVGFAALLTQQFSRFGL
ncbi:MAG: LptF/LptG family permease, partial [Pseudomonadota bacterium]